MSAAGRYSVIIEWSDEDRVYIATVPELPGCRTHGATRAEAVRKSEEALEGWLEVMTEDSRPIPAPSLFDGWSNIPGVATIDLRAAQKAVAS